MKKLPFHLLALALSSMFFITSCDTVEHDDDDDDHVHHQVHVPVSTTTTTTEETTITRDPYAPVVRTETIRSY